MEVIKRDGDVVEFDSNKILIAVRKAFKSSGESDNVDHDSEMIMHLVVQNLNQKNTVEFIQDCVEQSLMKDKFFKTAKKYILYREEHNKHRDQSHDSTVSKKFAESSKCFDYDPLREFVYMRTYSRWREEDGRRECWSETVTRYMDFMKENLGDKLSHDEYQEIENAILKQEVMPSMRLLQFAGNASRRCNATVYNCAYTAPECFKDLVDIMYLLMSGCGVGFSVEHIYVEKFPVIKASTGVSHKMTIEDSKEGWCDAFLVGLEKWYSGEDVVFDYSKLRPAGARLKTMGGRSSGPQPLKDLMEFSRSTIRKKTGSKLSSLNLYDMVCKIGQIVVAGGTRRSAMINLSNLGDTEIRDAKKGSFWSSHPQRCMTNNSAVYNEKPTMIEFMSEWLSLAESGTGERGIFNRGSLEKMLPKRRLEELGDEIRDLGTNPCGEIFILPKQFCNLSEVVCRATDDLESLSRKVRVATIIGTYQASLTDYKYISPKWKENQQRENLLGVSLTGQYDCPRLRNKDVLEKLKNKCIEVNEEYASRFGISCSTAITCTKPSGTVSQLTNTSSGIHPRFSKFYIRRIRISATDPLLKLMKDQGYFCNPEVGQSEETATTFVLDFPVKSPEGAICVKDVTALEQLEYWKMVRTSYTEHNPSSTIYVKEDEWLVIGQWIWDNWDVVSGLSFLPFTDHVYQLSPYEEIDESTYEEMSSKLNKVDFSKLIYYEKHDNTDVKREMACAGGACELN